MRRELGMFVALILMCAGLYVSNPDFLGESNVLNTTRQIAMLGIYAIGIGFVIITGGIDLSIGSIVGLTGVLMAATTLDGLGCFGPPLVAAPTFAFVLALIASIATGNNLLKWIALGGLGAAVAHNIVR